MKILLVIRRRGVIIGPSSDFQWTITPEHHSCRSRCICVRIGCAPQLRCRSLLHRRRPSFPAVLTCFHRFTTVWREVTSTPLCSYHLDTFSSQKLLNKDRQCCESWTDAELRGRAVSAVGDTTDEYRWVHLLCCDTAKSCLTNDTLTTFSSSSDCYDDWRRPSPTIRRPSYDASRRSVGVVYYAVVTTRLLLSACC